MTAAVFAKADRLAEQVREESRQLDPAKVVLTVLMVVPFVLGWVAAQTMRACWAVISWTWTALVVGWRTAYGRTEGGDTS
jgi:hypothetical protein